VLLFTYGPWVAAEAVPVVVSAVLPATSVLVALVVEEAEAVPQVLFKAIIDPHILGMNTTM
jgi:hypothetical protein